MAKMKNGILDGLNGKIGPVVAYQWKGRDCVRSYETTYRDPRTPKQQSCRQIFGVASRLAADMRAAVNIGFRGMAAVNQTTERGCFMRVNKQCFYMENNGVSIDYTTVKVAQGLLPAIVFSDPQLCEQGTVRVAFHTESGGKSTDYVLLFAYAPGTGIGRLSLPAARYQNVVSITLPRFWAGHEVHFYGFAWDCNSTTSDSVHIGTINLPQ